MFENLIESKPKKIRTRSQVVLSAILHVVLGAGAIYATKGAAEQMEKILADTNMVFLKPPEPPPPPPPETPPPDLVVSANPPPQGFQVVMPPNEIPKEIPPVNLNERFNAADFTGKGVEGGVAAGVVGGTGPVTGEAFLAEQVDDPVAPINQPRPRYPPVLQQAGVQGFVEVQFVVDTTGHAEPKITILKSSHPQFEAPAKEAVLKSVFKPAKIKGRAVRQLVQQRFGFTIGQ